MGLLDELKRLTKPYDDDEEDFFGADTDDAADEDPSVVAPKAERSARRNPFAAFETAVPPFGEKPAAASAAKKDNKVVNIQNTTAVKVVLSKPVRFEQAADIADHLREKRTVVMNLETTNKDVARRLVDFLSGVAYANDGKIKKVAINTYIITPYNVDIMGDLIDELENNGVYI